jgi:hypothetical protein
MVCTRPREKRQDGSRVSLSISVIEVVGGRIIEIDRQFYQSQAENTCVEVNVRLRFAGNGSYMMQSSDFGHARLSFLLRSRLSQWLIL